MTSRNSQLSEFKSLSDSITAAILALFHALNTIVDIGSREEFKSSPLPPAVVEAGSNQARNISIFPVIASWFFLPS